MGVFPLLGGIIETRCQKRRRFQAGLKQRAGESTYRHPPSRDITRRIITKQPLCIFWSRGRLLSSCWRHLLPTPHTPCDYRHLSCAFKYFLSIFVFRASLLQLRVSVDLKAPPIKAGEPIIREVFRSGMVEPGALDPQQADILASTMAGRMRPPPPGVVPVPGPGPTVAVVPGDMGPPGFNGPVAGGGGGGGAPRGRGGRRNGRNGGGKGHRSGSKK